MKTNETSPLAIASLALSCLGVLTAGILAIPGIVCGHLAKKQVRRGEYVGHSLAQAGIVVGIAVLILWVAVPMLIFGGVGLFALAAYNPWITAGLLILIVLLALLPLAFTSMARRRDCRSLHRLVDENRRRS